MLSYTNTCTRMNRSDDAKRVPACRDLTEKRDGYVMHAIEIQTPLSSVRSHFAKMLFVLFTDLDLKCPLYLRCDSLERIDIDLMFICLGHGHLSNEQEAS